MLCLTTMIFWCILTLFSLYLLKHAHYMWTTDGMKDTLQRVVNTI